MKKLACTLVGLAFVSAPALAERPMAVDDAGTAVDGEAAAAHHLRPGCLQCWAWLARLMAAFQMGQCFSSASRWQAARSFGSASS